MDLQPIQRDTNLLPRETLGRLGRDLNTAMVVGNSRSRRSAPLDRPQTTLTWGRAYLPAHFAKPASRLHEWLGAELDAMRASRGARVNLIGPRGSAKSTVATLCHVLHAALEGWERYIWIVSDTKEQAETHLDNVKAELVDNRRLRTDYASAVGHGRRWRANSIELANGVVIESYGTGQRIRGRRRSADRPSLIVCDDLQNDSHISSAVQREASRQWFQGTLLNAGTKHTNIVNLATALHREALALALHRTAGWTSRNFPAIESWPSHTELWQEWEDLYCDVDNPHAKSTARAFYDKRHVAMNAGASVLWPAVEDLYTLMQMRVEIGQTAFEREKQGSPVNPEFCEWPESYFGEHTWFDKWPEKLLVRTIALDPSKGREAGRGDYSAYVLLGVDSNGVMYVEADIDRRPTPQMVADGIELCRRFNPHAFGVEANQFQELLCGELATELAKSQLNHIIPAAIHNHVNKVVRIRRLGPYLSQRRLRFLVTSPATRMLVDQLHDFPAGAHDDGPDALEMAIRLADEVLNAEHQNDGLGDRLPIDFFGS